MTDTPRARRATNEPRCGKRQGKFSYHVNHYQKKKKLVMKRKFETDTMISEIKTKGRLKYTLGICFFNR